jgi:gliding motility-associated-like protein
MGVEFSPNSTKVYFAAQQINTTNWAVYQYDLCASNVAASQVTISNNPYEDVRSLQLAPDDKIYVARWNGFGPGYDMALALINDPNVAGTGCNYTDSAIYLGGRMSWFGLPGFAASYFYQGPQFTWTSVCAYDPVNFTMACNTDTPDSVRWNFDDPSSGANNTSAVINASHTFSSAGTYNVQAIVYFECRTDTVISVVTLAPPPAVTVTPNDSVCPGNSIVLNAGGALSYAWSPAASLSSSTGSSVTATPTVTTTYSVIGTDSSGCVDTNTVTITMVAAPTASVAGNSTICSGSSATLTASGGTSYSWSTAATTAVITVSPTTTTTYTVTASNGVCTDTASFTVVVMSNPSASISGNNIICTGGTANLTATGGGTYSWNTGATSGTVSVSPSSTTTYTVVVSLGTCTDTAFYTVNVLPPPTAQVSGADSVCAGSTVVLNASGGISYSWSTGQTTTSIAVIPFSTTTYFVIASNGTCTDTAFFTVNTLAGPAANAGPDATFNIGGSATLTGTGGGTYSWSPSTGLSCTTCPSPVASPTVTTTYILAVTNASGCVDFDTVTVYVTMNCDAAEGDVFIPDAFSPNGDGFNEVLYVRGGGMKTIVFAVYDRWGINVFESTSQAVGWDGTMNGKLLNPGVYVYVLKAECLSGESFTFKGNITLLR